MKGWNLGLLKDLKASDPIELAEYAVGNQLVEEPAFRWWVKDALRTRNRIFEGQVPVLEDHTQVWH